MDSLSHRPLLEKIYYTTILFLYVFAPTIVGLPYNPAKFMFLIIVAEALYLNVFNIKKIFIPQIALYVVLLVFTWGILIYHGTFGRPEHAGPVQQILTQVLEMIPFSILFINILIRRGYSINDFIEVFINIMAIQGLLMLLQFVSADFRVTVQQLLGATKIKSVGTFQWFRGLGVSLSKNYDFALLQSFGMFLLISKFLRNKMVLLDYAKIFLIVFSIIISGRTGFVGLGFATAVFIFKTVRYQAFISFLKKASVVIGVVYGLYMATAFVLPNVYSSINNNLLPWAFEFYYNFMETGEFSTDSSDQLNESHYYALPDKTIVYGDGKYVRPDGFYYGLTDAGYMRQTLYFGVIGILIFAVIYIRIAYINFTRLSANYNFIVPSIAFLLFVAHYKGDVFTNSLILNRTFYVLGIGFILYMLKAEDEQRLHALTRRTDKEKQ